MKVRSILSYCLLALTASASQIGLKDAKLSLITSDGSTEKVYSLQPPTPAISSDSPPIALESDHILRLSFLTTGLDEGVTLKQNHIQFKDISSGAVTNLPIAIKRNGLGKFDLKVSSLPSSLRKTSGTLSLRLLLASSSSSIKPLSYQIASISLPKNKLSPPPVGRHDISKASPEEGKPAFKALPEIKHTFGTPEKEVGGVISAIGTVVVLAPWVGLAYLVSFGRPPFPLPSHCVTHIQKDASQFLFR